MAEPRTGQAPFEFIYRPDLSKLPQSAQGYEVNLHGGFAVDDRPGFGHIYYGMPGCGLMRIEPDLKKQEVIKLPSNLKQINFHSTKIGDFYGKRRLFLPANDDEQVVVLSLAGDVDFVLPKPELDIYQNEEANFKPTDVVLIENQLFVADGYGENYILSADIRTHQWNTLFGGLTKNPEEHGKFGTAHGLNLEPKDNYLAIADRWNSRIQLHDHHGSFIASHKLPKGTWPCGIQYIEFDGRWLAVIGCLYDDVAQLDKPAPIYILDGLTYDILSVIRPKIDLGIELAQKLHNVIWYEYDNQFFLVCQSWNPGHYFILQKV